MLARLQNLFKRLFPPPSATTTGSQRSLSSISASVRRRYDLEIQENPIRDPYYGREYIELLEYCYEVRHCLSMAMDDSFASSDGDDMGWKVSDTFDDETPINKEVYAIATDLAQRAESHENYVIGGDKLKRALRNALGYGDCFLELGIEKEGIGRNDYGINRTLYLPTWELFRKETDQGLLEGFEQRRHLTQSQPDYFFYPPQIVHFRHEPRFLYGESIYKQSLDAWAKLKEATENLANAARDLGINPNLHILWEEADKDHLEAYRMQHEQVKLDGIITDFYLYSGQEIKKLSGVNPNLSPLIENVLMWKYRCIIPGIPTYYIPGLQSEGGTKDLSGEPAKRYARMRNSWCSLLVKGIKQAIDTEIILKKGWDWYQENGNYRIVFPEWKISAQGVSQEDSANNANNANNASKNVTV